MGKRKSSSKPITTKKKVVLPTTFSCLFCNHEQSVIVKLNKKAGVGDLSCKVCGQHFQSGINYLSAAVDVYSDWIDACDAVAKETADDAPSSANYQAVARKHGLSKTTEDDDAAADADGFIVNDEIDGEAEYDDV